MDGWMDGWSDVVNGLKISRLVAGVCLALSGCTGDDNATNILTCGNFEFGLSIKDRFGQHTSHFSSGEEITFQMRISNTSNSPKTLNVSWAGRPTGFQVKTSSNQLVWDSEEGFAYPAVVTPIVYAAGEATVATAK